MAVNTAGELVVPNGSIGFRWGEKGKWNLESIAAGTETELSLTLLGQHDAVAGVAFPYFGGIENPHFLGKFSKKSAEYRAEIGYSYLT